MSEQQMTYDGTQSTYAEIRRRWAEGVADVVSTAVPFPKRRAGGFRLKAEPTIDEPDDELD